MRRDESSSLANGRAGKRPVIAEGRRLAFRFPGQTADLLREVDFSVHAGEVVVLAGPNGSGKSTLLGLLSGRLRPTAGQVSVFGRDPARTDRLPEVGVLTEPFHPQQSPLPVDSNLRQIFQWLRILDGVSPDAARSGLEDVGIGDPDLDRPIRLFSKGERQRVLLLVVSLRRPRLILADEPLEGLDPATRRLTADQLVRRAREGTGVVWVSHHLGEVASHADRLLDIDAGRLRERTAERIHVEVTADGRRFAEEPAWGLLGLPELAGAALRERSSIRLDVSRAEESR